MSHRAPYSDPIRLMLTVSPETTVCHECVDFTLRTGDECGGSSSSSIIPLAHGTGMSGPAGLINAQADPALWIEPVDPNKAVEQSRPAPQSRAGQSSWQTTRFADQ